MRVKSTRQMASGDVQVIQTRGGLGSVGGPEPPALLGAIDKTKILEHSKSHPRMLRSNATSHIWAFGALAELVDNAQDDEAQARNVWIQGEGGSRSAGKITVQDDGLGMTRERLHCMLSFGFSKKEHLGGNVGRFGIGAKSGSIRIGDDVLVLTREKDTVSLALLSLSFLEGEKADDILLPMLTWSIERGNVRPLLPESAEEWQWSVHVIMRYSFLRSETAMMAHVTSRQSTGTTITIFNLRQPSEFEFLPDDIHLKGDDGDPELGGRKALHYQQNRDGQQVTAFLDLFISSEGLPLGPVEPTLGRLPLAASLAVREDHSLRAYLEILYLKPRVEIFLQGKPVTFRDPLQYLNIQRQEFGPYNPNFPGITGEIKCWFGYNQESGKLCGTHIYHKNRLIRMYQRFGSQLQANCMMKDLLGVAVADCLTPTHNKQDFDSSSIIYSRFKTYLVKSMSTYYFSKQTHRTAGKGERRIKKRTRRARQAGVEPLSGTDTDEAAEEQQLDSEDDLELSPPSRKKTRSLDGQTQEKWIQLCLGEWKRVQYHQSSVAFREPVDVGQWGCYDYYEVITEPMDLSTVKEKLNGNKYLSPLEFKRDMLLIFSNALRYNGPAHPISRLAVKLKDMFLKGWAARVRRILGLREEEGGGDTGPLGLARPAESAQCSTMCEGSVAAVLQALGRGDQEVRQPLPSMTSREREELLEEAVAESSPPQDPQPPQPPPEQSCGSPLASAPQPAPRTPPMASPQLSAPELTPELPVSSPPESDPQPPPQEPGASLQTSADKPPPKQPVGFLHPPPPRPPQQPGGSPQPSAPRPAFQQDSCRQPLGPQQQPAASEPPPLAPSDPPASVPTQASPAGLAELPNHIPEASSEASEGGDSAPAQGSPAVALDRQAAASRPPAMTAAEPLDAAAVPPGAPDRAEGAIPSGEVTQATWAASDAADAQAVAEVAGRNGAPPPKAGASISPPPPQLQTLLAQLEAIQKREADERARAARLEEENARLAQRNRELEQLQSGTLPALPSQQQQQQPRQRRSNDGDIKRVRAENKSLRDRNEELESQLAMLRAALHRKQRD